jgi:hypothetical protein
VENKTPRGCAAFSFHGLRFAFHSSNAFGVSGSVGG